MGIITPGHENTSRLTCSTLAINRGYNNAIQGLDINGQTFWLNADF